MQGPITVSHGGDDRGDVLREEFERQLDTLVARGYPWLAGMTDEVFRARLAPLADRLGELPQEVAGLPPAGEVDGDGWLRRVPFVLVAGRDLVDPEHAAARVVRRGRELIVSMLDAGAFAAFRSIEQVAPPEGAYLLVGADTGVETRNDPPDVALPKIVAQGRSPLTLEEGIAFLTHHPEAVATNAGFSLVGSRRDDRRVTAMWVSRGAPKLGWCFAGAPHTWLGSASCAGRIGR